MTDELCPHCGQTMPVRRLGVKLSPLKACIFDHIKRAGVDGISSDALFWLVFADRRGRKLRGLAPVQRCVLKAHVAQINDAIEGTGFYIRGTPGRTSYYVLRQRRRERQRAAA